MSEFLSRLGARFGNWNDRMFGPEFGRHPNRRVWRRLDRAAAWFFILPERGAGR